MTRIMVRRTDIRLAISLVPAMIVLVLAAMPVVSTAALSHAPR